MPDKSEIGDAVLEYWYGHADEADRLRPLFAALLVRDDDIRSRKMYPLQETGNIVYGDSRREGETLDDIEIWTLADDADRQRLDRRQAGGTE